MLRRRTPMPTSVTLGHKWSPGRGVTSDRGGSIHNTSTRRANAVTSWRSVPANEVQSVPALHTTSGRPSRRPGPPPLRRMLVRSAPQVMQGP